MSGIVDFIAGDSFSKLIDKVLDFIPNPAEKQRKKQELLDELQKEAAQTDRDNREINKIEAAHPSLFVAGWRPMVGWFCAFSFGWLALINPFLNYILVAFGQAAVNIPMDSTLLMTTLSALLGVAGLRSFDKYMDTDTKRTK